MVRHRAVIARCFAGAFLAAGLWSVAGWALAAEVAAQLDRDQVVEGETVTLILQTDDPAQSLDADLTALEPDFELLDRRSETQMSIVGGRQAAVVRLMLTLEPRRSGILEIPALSYPGGQTRPLQLTVAPAPEPVPGEMPPVFIELALDPDQGPYYVHAQLSLTVKIFYQQNLTEATINPPTPEQASVRLLDEVPFPAERNGVRFRVLQRRYAIFPERSGTLEIPPMRLTGRLIERPADRLWQPSVRGRRITEESRPLSVEILPRPAEFTGAHWLPARDITLEQQLSDIEGIRVGEPVTRTIILDAVGLEENMLEEPSWPELRDARIYPDQPQGISRDDGQWVRGHKEFRYAIVPEVDGELVLPEIRLEWWDTVADQARIASVPEVRVPVAPSSLVPALPGSAAGQILSDGGAMPAGDGASRAEARLWRGIALAFGALWLATLGLLIRRRRSAPDERRAGPGMPADEATLLDCLKQACQREDAAGVRRYLRRWLLNHGPQPAHGSIVRFTDMLDDPGLRGALQAFEAGGYRKEGASHWSGRELWKQFSRWHAATDRAARSSQHAPGPRLYGRR